MSALLKLICAIKRDTRAVAMTEFAVSAPLLLTAGLWGLETANFALTNLRISQAAMLVADNASRVGDTSQLDDRKIYESDVNDLLFGSFIQTGSSLDLYEHGRVIVSSLEVLPDSDPPRQYIHWQRCKGKKVFASSYGVEGDGSGVTAIPGMGPSGEEVVAIDDEAVMFVEIAYEYQPIFTDVFISDKVINTHSAFNVRVSRDLTQIYQRDESNPDAIADCNVHDGFATVT